MTQCKQQLVRIIVCGSLVVIISEVHAQRSGQDIEKHYFDITPNESYGDLIQYADGYVEAAQVYYFSTPVDGLNRVVIFFKGDSPVGTAYVDREEKRLVVTRRLDDFATLSYFQDGSVNNYIYGQWEKNADGTVVKFALQRHRSDGAIRQKEELPALGAEYSGSGNSESSSKNVP